MGEMLATIDLFDVLMVGSALWMAYILIYWNDYNRIIINDRRRTKKTKG